MAIHEEGALYQHMEYGELSRFVYTAEAGKMMNPSMAVSQDRLVLEKIVNSILGEKGILANKIVELQERWHVPEKIIDEMNTVRALGNLGAHDHEVFWKEAEKSLSTLVKVMRWYGKQKFQYMHNPSMLGEVQYTMYVCEKDGIGTAINESSALSWLKKAARNDCICALRDLGEYYFLHKIKDKYVIGETYLKKAIQKGSNDAKLILAIIYLGNHEGIKHDLAKGYTMLKECTSKGNIFAEYNLVSFFDPFYTAEYGINITNEERFNHYIHIIQEASDNNFFLPVINRTYFRLAECYQYGIGTKENPIKVFECYQKLANQKDGKGLFKLGECYEKGIGVDIDLLKAKKNYILSSTLGNPLANPALCRVQHKLGEL